jgi:hypothetical protein
MLDEVRRHTIVGPPGGHEHWLEIEGGHDAPQSSIDNQQNQQSPIHNFQRASASDRRACSASLGLDHAALTRGRP